MDILWATSPLDPALDNGRWGAAGDDLYGWRRPRRVLVGDLFAPTMPAPFIASVLASAAHNPRHTLIVSTEHPERMRDLLVSGDVVGSPSGPLTLEAMTRNCYHNERNRRRLGDAPLADALPWPLPNVWLGVRVSGQAGADAAIPALLGTPAAARWVWCQPGEPVDLTRHLGQERGCACRAPLLEGAGPHPVRCECRARAAVDWVVAGGVDVLLAHPAWVRAVRDQCAVAGVPFHFAGSPRLGWAKPPASPNPHSTSPNE